MASFREIFRDEERSSAGAGTNDDSSFSSFKMRVQLWNRLLPSQDASPIVEEFSVFDKKGDGNDILVQMDSAMLLEEKQRGKIFGSTSPLMFRTFTRAGSRLLL